MKWLEKDVTPKDVIVDSIGMFIQNATIQQYFKYNTHKYCELIAILLESFNNLLPYNFLDKNIPKTLINSENFLKHFLEILLPCFERCLIKNECMFQVFSRIIQKVSNSFVYLACLI